jgi:hypothetical protein
LEFFDGGVGNIRATKVRKGVRNHYLHAHRYLWGQAVDELLAQENIQPDGQGGWQSTPDDLFWILQDRLSSVCHRADQKQPVAGGIRAAEIKVS